MSLSLLVIYGQWQKISCIVWPCNDNVYKFAKVQLTNTYYFNCPVLLLLPRTTVTVTTITAGSLMATFGTAAAATATLTTPILQLPSMNYYCIYYCTFATNTTATASTTTTVITRTTAATRTISSFFKSVSPSTIPILILLLLTITIPP